MKKNIINTIAVLGILAGLCTAAVAPWWAVLFICIPAIYAAVLALLKVNTNYIEEV